MLPTRAAMLLFALDQELITSALMSVHVPRELQSSGQHVLVLRLSGVLQTAGNCAQAKGSTASSSKTLIVPDKNHLTRKLLMSAIFTNYCSQGRC